MKELSAKKLRSEQTISRIMDAAAWLFVTQGYHGTSISAIAEAVGLTKGALYSHFKGKADLLFALIKLFETDFLDELIKAVESAPGNAMDKLHRFVSFSSEFAENNRALCVLLTTLSAEFSGEANEFASELRRIYFKYARFLMRLAEKGKAQGVFDAGLDSHSLAYTIIAIHDGVLLQWHRSRDLLEGPLFVRTFRRVLVQGVAPLKDQN